MTSILSKGEHVPSITVDRAPGSTIPLLLTFPHSGESYPDVFLPNPSLAFEVIDFPNDTFDRVMFTGYLGHIQNRKESLEEILRVLRTKGRLVGLVTNSWSPWYWLGLRKILSKDYGVLPKDLEFSPIYLYRLLKSAGFKKIKINIFNSLPGSLPNSLYYPGIILNHLLFSIYPLKLMGWHILLSAEK